MNITIDNYEAYLIDYLDGNLNEDETRQLQQFVAAQGLDWAELTEGLPHLKAPQIVYENKNNLCRRFDRLNDLKPLSAELVEESKSRHKPTFIPLYVKIASAAAAAGLLLTVVLWPQKSMPKVEPIAELTPIPASISIEEKPFQIMPRKIIAFNECQIAPKKAPSELKRKEVEVIAALSPMVVQEIASSKDTDFLLATDIELLRCRLENEMALTRLTVEPTVEEKMPTSLIGRGIYRMTEGRYASIGSLINAGLHIAKKEAVKASTDAAMTAYYRVEDHIEEAKEQWQEKREE